MKFYTSEALRNLGLTFTEPRAGDAGYDLYATETAVIKAGGRVAIPSGVFVEIPLGYVGLVADRSSVALSGLHTLGGVIDSSYRGEIRVILHNLTPNAVEVQAGRKIAQLLVLPCLTVALTEVLDVGDLSSSERGHSGFGSTGK